MTKKSDNGKPQISRRAFLGSGAAAGAASVLPGGSTVEAQESSATVAAAEAKAQPLSPSSKIFDEKWPTVLLRKKGKPRNFESYLCGSLYSTFKTSF